MSLALPAPALPSPLYGEVFVRDGQAYAGFPLTTKMLEALAVWRDLLEQGWKTGKGNTHSFEMVDGHEWLIEPIYPIQEDECSTPKAPRLRLA